MSRRDDIEPEAERILDELLDAASEEAEHETIEPPPFGAILGRARRIEPTLESWSSNVGDAEPVDDEIIGSDLSAFIEAARAEAELDIEDQLHEGPPGLPLGGRSTTHWWIVGAIVAAAAAIVMVFGVFEVQQAWRADNAFEGSQALDQAEAERRSGAAENRVEPEPTPAPIRRSTTRVRPPPAPQHEVIPEQEVPLETIAPEPESEPESEPVPAPKSKAKHSRAERKQRREAALRELDATAQTQLAAGQLDAAEGTLRTIVRKGGRSTLAQLAYGDLFTLAHRSGDGAMQTELWRTYLDSFPRGRFADDARAGLCRRASSANQADCWRRYLADFPTGAYHRQAMRAQPAAVSDRSTQEPDG